MKNYGLFPLALCLLSPLVCQAQKLAQIDCPHPEGNTYLYSSTTTMEIGATVKCGQQVHVLGRFDNFYHVRTEKGEDGFVPVDSISFVKAAQGAKTSASRSKGKQPSAPLKAEPHAPAPIQEVVLSRQTPVHLKFLRSISSASARVGEEVNFEVAEEVAIGGFVLIPKGAPATGTVTEAEPKRRMGHGGKLSVSVTSVRLADNEKAALQSVQEEKGTNQKVGMVIPLMRGKDITFAEGTEIIAYVGVDMRLKTSKLHAAHASSTAAAASKAN